MTIRYSRDVSSSSFLCLYKLLFKWKGSIWKSVWCELFIWMVLYAILSVIYRFVLNQDQREVFEDVSAFCETYSNFLPITFMLGFYVNAVFGRWQKVFDNFGWIDIVAVATACHVKGTSELARNLRRNAVRYMVLLQAIIFRDISMRVKRRFPTMNHLVTAGFLTEDELKEFEALPAQYPKYWVPLEWSCTTIKRARDEGFISDDITYAQVIDKICTFRNTIITHTFFDWVQVPMAYTQVVHLAVRTYCLLMVMGRQFLRPTRTIIGFKQPMDMVIPFVSCLQLVFLIGWIKVAEVMLNPFGEDDDDFETNWIIDRNLQVGLCMVDDQYNKIPEVKPDAFWGDVLVEPLYTPETCAQHCNPQIGSCVTIEAPDEGFMVRMRRRTVSTGIKVDPEEQDIVPVVGTTAKVLEKPKNENLQRGGSFANTTRRLSAIVKKFRTKVEPRRGSVAPSTNETNCTERRDVERPVERLERPQSAPNNQRRFTIVSVPDLEQLAEEERRRGELRRHYSSKM